MNAKNNENKNKPNETLKIFNQSFISTLPYFVQLDAPNIYL